MSHSPPPVSSNPRPPESKAFLKGSKTYLAVTIAIVVVGATLIFNALLRRTINDHRSFSASVLNIDRMEQALYRMEGANNSFLLMGGDDSRVLFNRQRDILSANYKEVVRFTVNDPAQQARLKEFKANLTKWFALYNPLVVRRRLAQKNDSKESSIKETELDALNECKLIFEQMMSLLDEIQTTQEYKSNQWPESDGAAFFQVLPDISSDSEPE